MNVRVCIGVCGGMWKIERMAGEGWTAHPAGWGAVGVGRGRHHIRRDTSI